MPIQHVYTQTVADGTATSVVRPSDWNSNHRMVYNLSGNTLGSSQISGNDITLQGSNVTLSADIAGSKLVFMGPPTATATMWFPFNEAVNVAGQVGQGILHFVPVPTPGNIGGDGVVSIDRVCFPVIFSNTSNSTGSITISQWFGLYQRENTTATRLTLMHSTSFSSQFIYSGTTNNSILSGIRILTCPWTTSFVDNRYVVANLSRTTSGGGNATFSQLLVSNINTNFSGVLGAASNATAQWPMGWGQYSATTSGLPSSVGYSQIQGTNSQMMRNPEWFMVNGTA